MAHKSRRCCRGRQGAPVRPCSSSAGPVVASRERHQSSSFVGKGTVTAWSTVAEPLGVERDLLAPQVIDGPAQLRFQQRQGLAFMDSVATGRPEPASWLPAPRVLAETSAQGPGASP
jgi:hypothetical protein